MSEQQGFLFGAGAYGDAVVSPSALAGPDFDGPDYEPELDKGRLNAQMERIFTLMADGIWRTLAEIETATGDPEASVSAQLRHLRKERFGAHTVDKRRRGEESRGLWEYRLIVNGVK